MARSISAERPGPLGLHDVADRLGVHYMTVYRYVRTGRLEATKAGSTWTVDAAALDAFTSPRAVVATPSAARRSTARSTAGPTGPARVARLDARLVAGDRRGALDLVDAALAGGATWSEVELDLLAAALHSIGERWAAGELSVGDEHRATVVAQQLLAVLGTRFTRRGRRRGTVVLGAAPGDAHQLPVAIVADHLRAAGFEVVDFGADTPVECFAEAAASEAPLAVAVGATTADRRPAVRRVVRAVHAAAPGVPVLVGGAAIADADAAERLGADGWTGPDARAVVAAVETWRAARRSAGRPEVEAHRGAPGRRPVAAQRPASVPRGPVGAAR